MQEAKRRPIKAAATPKIRGKNLRRLRRARRGDGSAPLPDRRVFDPPKSLKIAVDVIDDPFGIAISAQKLPKQRRDGTTTGGDGEWVSPGQPQITVLRSIRTDPLGWMRSHSQIDEAEYLAGRHWQSLYERSSVGSVQAVDTSKEPVDGGKFPELITDNQRKALEQLRGASICLVASAMDRNRGIARAQLIQDVLATGMFIKTAALVRGITAERAVAALAREFHQTLSVLAGHFGFAGTLNKNKNKVRGWRQEDGKVKENKEAGSKVGQEKSGKVWYD